jgi:hypothetical protein
LPMQMPGSTGGYDVGGHQYGDGSQQPEQTWSLPLDQP